jgi:hypothetical protein
MNFARIASRVAVGGVSAALATAGLVGVTTTSASAATATTNYTCSVPGVFTDTFPVSVTVPLIPATAPAGYPVPAGLLSFTSTLTAPATIAPTLTGLGINGAKSTDFGTALGDKVAPAPVTWGTATTNPDTSVTLSGSGSNAAFTLPEAGTYAVNMPKQFTLIPTVNGNPFPASATCTSAAPSTIASITLSKQPVQIKAKAPKSAKVGKVVTVKGKVSNDYSKTGGEAVTGKVTVKDGKKKVGTAKIKNGKFTVKVKGLKVGTHSLTVSYKGDGFTDKGVSKAIKVKVTK